LRKVEYADHEHGLVNEKLRERLQQWRSDRFKADNVPAYSIMHQSTLLEIAARIPKTKAELLRIKGFGDGRFKKYGAEILEICTEFDKEKEK
jgi:ATP-dependent DNA helicase RecQ